MSGLDFTANAKFFKAVKTPMLPKETFKGRVAYITGNQIYFKLFFFSQKTKLIIKVAVLGWVKIWLKHYLL